MFVICLQFAVCILIVEGFKFKYTKPYYLLLFVWIFEYDFRFFFSFHSHFITFGAGRWHYKINVQNSGAEFKNKIAKRSNNKNN